MSYADPIMSGFFKIVANPLAGHKITEEKIIDEQLYAPHQQHTPHPIFFIRPTPGLLPVLGLLERYKTPTLDSALFISSRAGADLGRTSDS